MRNRVTVQPTVEPVSLAQAKLHLRVTTTEQDTIIFALIKAAREYVENYCCLSLVTQTREQLEFSFYSEIPLLYGPVQSVTGITYLDTDGVSQTLATSTYITDLTGEIPIITTAYSEFYPQSRRQYNAVTITYVAGFTGSGSPLDLTAGIPEMIKTAMLMLIGHWYDNAREASTPVALTVAPLGVEHLLMPHRVYLF